MVADEHARGIELSDVLKGFDLVDAGDDWTDDSQLMGCPNMRACQFYLRRGYVDSREKIVSQLLSEPRVDQAIWWESESGKEAKTYCVATTDRGALSFSRANGHGGARDEFGNSWKFTGQLAAVDAELVNGRLVYRDYPNAFERIASSFYQPTSGDLWSTARPGHEFKLSDMEVHEAGSHGSLHALDSLAPLIVAGLPAGVTVPDPVRTVDVVPICKQLLGLTA